MNSAPFSRVAVATALLLAAHAARAEFIDFTSASGIFGEGPTWGAPALDLDGDGDADFINHRHALSFVIFTNDGTGSFSTSGIPQMVSDIQDRHGFLWADLDNDGEMDAVCSHGGDGGCGCADNGNELWQGLGSGNYQLVVGAGGMSDPTGRGRGFSGADIDGDGDLDLYHAKAPLAASPDALYRNDGSLSFVDVAGDWGIDFDIGTVSGLFSDFDQDGDPDLFVGGEEFSRPSTLFRNDDSVFVDVTATVFPTLPIVAGADWGDFDNDGDEDLAVVEGEEGVFDAYGIDGNDFWFFAHHRLGDDGQDIFFFDTDFGIDPVAFLQWRGTFQASRIFLGPSGVHPGGPAITLTDAYVGMPTFTPGVDEGMYVWRESAGGAWNVVVSAPPGTAGNYSGTVFTAAGLDTTSSSNLEMVAITPTTPRVYRNDAGVFADVTATLGFTASVNPRHVTWVDFDNDGDLDLHQVNKGTAMLLNEADILWRNDGVAGFVELTGSENVPGQMEHLGDGGVWLDLENDGDLDLALVDGAGPAFYNNSSMPFLYRNDGTNGNWLRLSLGQTLSGGTSVGAKVTCYADSATVCRWSHANVWRGFQGSRTLHFGLGGSAFVDSLVIDWPNSSTQTVLGPFPTNTTWDLDETDTIPVVSVPGVAEELNSIASAAWPQPARGTQSIRLSLPREAQLEVRVYDVSGRSIRSLLRGSVPSGTSTLTWDGRDDSGRSVAAGLYFVRATGDLVFVRKLVRLR